MKEETTPGASHYLYLVDSRLGLAKPGVAPVPNQRLRELQVGSPVRLRLALAVPYPTRVEARAVLAALARQFASRRAHGSWFRITTAEVRRALEHPAPREAAAGAGVSRSAERTGRPGPAPRRSPRPRTEKEFAYQRRRRRQRGAKQRQAARLLARGHRQVEVASALGVTARTLRNWGSAPVFARALERELARYGRARAEAAPAAERVPPRARRPRAAAATAPAAATEAPELPRSGDPARPPAPAPPVAACRSSRLRPRVEPSDSPTTSCASSAICRTRSSTTTT